MIVLPTHILLPTDRMPEAEVSLRLAFALLASPGSAAECTVSLDEKHAVCHGKQIFPVAQFMQCYGWVLVAQRGKMMWEGVYQNGAAKMIITTIPGLGDIIIRIDNQLVRVESKGGPIIKKKGNPERPIICRLIGQLMLSKPAESGEVLIAAVPDTPEFGKLVAKCKKAPRLAHTGIQFVLVNRTGDVDGLAEAI